MASSLLISSFSSTIAIENREPSCNSTGSAFLHNSKLLFTVKPRKSAVRRCRFKSPVARKSLDHIPKQFREENLKDGLMDNFKNAPQCLYGLTPRQMEMFMTEDNPVNRQAENVTEESISSRYNYLSNGGMYSLSDMNDKEFRRYSMSATMYRGGRRGYGRPRSAPPDLPSLLLDARIVYLGLPIVPAVAELIVAELMWLDYDNPTQPIYMYINCSGTLNEKMEIVGSETDAYAIADSMSFCKPPIYTINLGMSFGQAAMLLSLGKKGYRGLQPHCSTKLHLPKVHRSSGAASDMWIKAKELDANAQSYIELVAKGTGKTKEEIEKDISHPKYFRPEEAIEYGIADKILYSMSGSYDERNRDKLPADSQAMRKEAGAGSLQAASGIW